MNNSAAFSLYKPLRNYLRQFPLLQSLDVIRAYAVHLQLNVPMPNYIQVDRSFPHVKGTPQQYVHEWELDVLAREVILNCPESAAKTLRSWDAFGEAINKIKTLENDLYEEYRELHNKNILLQLYRIGHRQFPWQRKPSENVMLRYFKIFGTPELEPILRTAIGITASQLHALGLCFAGNFMGRFGFNLDGRMDIPGITQEDYDHFVRHFSLDVESLRNKIRDTQSYDQDYAYTFNPLRLYPLVKVVLNGKETLTAPIPTLLFRRVTEGVYYEICGASGFDNAFGKSFQRYVGDVLKKVNDNGSFTVLEEQPYHVGKDRKDSVDWIVSDKTADLFVECKTKKLRWGSKIGLASTEMLDEDLDKLSGFIVQTYKTLADALNKKYGHWSVSDRPVYPLIVTLEDWYIWTDPIGNAIEAAVASKMNEENLDLSMLDKYPYAICSVGELETGIQIMRQTGIRAYMEKKCDKRVRFSNFHNITLDVFRDEVSRINPSLFREDIKNINSAITIPI